MFHGLWKPRGATQRPSSDGRTWRPWRVEPAGPAEPGEPAQAAEPAESAGSAEPAEPAADDPNATSRPRNISFAPENTIGNPSPTSTPQNYHRPLRTRTAGSITVTSSAQCPLLTLTFFFRRAKGPPRPSPLPAYAPYLSASGHLAPPQAAPATGAQSSIPMHPPPARHQAREPGRSPSRANRSRFSLCLHRHRRRSDLHQSTRHQDRSNHRDPNSLYHGDISYSDSDGQSVARYSSNHSGRGHFDRDRQGGPSVRRISHGRRTRDVYIQDNRSVDGGSSDGAGCRDSNRLSPRDRRPSHTSQPSVAVALHVHHNSANVAHSTGTGTGTGGNGTGGNGTGGDGTGCSSTGGDGAGGSGTGGNA